MKIALISINAHTKVLNFASPLHTYVFQQFLLDNGIQTTIVDYKPIYFKNFDVEHPLFYYINHPCKDEAKQKDMLKRWKDLFYEREVRYRRFEEFIEKYYKKTKKCYNAKVLDRKDMGFDCYICVTDVIWSIDPSAKDFDMGFLLNCKSMEGKKKIAYSASRGARTYKPEQAETFFAAISDIDFISVREESLKTYIESGLDVPVTRVLDPVFLKDKDFYSNLAMQPEKQDYVLIYTVMEKGEPIANLAVDYAKEHNLKVIDISDRPAEIDLPEGVTYEYRYDIGVEEWLGYMEKATCIFTNSFHCGCFSVIFEKEFYMGKRDGDKVDCLLETFGLNHRRFEEDSTLADLDESPIDFASVRVIRAEWIQKSKDYILNAIHYLEEHPHQNHSDRRKVLPESITSMRQRFKEKFAET